LAAQAGTADQKNREWIGTAQTDLRLFGTSQCKNISTDGGSGPAPQPPMADPPSISPGLKAGAFSFCLKERIVGTFL
jgi:hypothetical protein